MHFSRYALFASVSASAILLSSAAHSLPQGGQVAAGSATIASSGSATTIAQGSGRAILDWSSFDIGAGERVTFQQPSAAAVALNRIGGQKPSEIFGRLSANGQVILTNPNGLLFGPSSRVDVAGLVATTATIGTDAFMRDGSWAFSSSGRPGASIVNRGTITAREAGLVALVAPAVENKGFIGARLGKIQLAGADTFTLDLYGDGLLSFAAAKGSVRVGNAGTLLARAGDVLLTAAQGAWVLESVVNNTGIIDVSASRIDPSGIVVFGDGIGGDIALSARSIDVGSGSVLNASGPTGGGTLHVGGARQGAPLSLAGQALPNAEETTIAADSRLSANATAKGDGGTIIAWADGHTRFDGQIEAKGGPAGGDGGFVETSGQQQLGVSGTVDASASEGRAGDWLLDPRNVTISGAGAYPVNPAGETVDPGSDNFTILDSSISTALSNGNNVTITTGTSGAQAGDITLNGATIAKSGGGNATLTLKADNSILTSGINTISSSAGKLHTIFWADANVHSGTAGGIIQLNDTTVSTNGGDLVLAGGLDNGANGGTAADGRPDNYAWGNAGYPQGITLAAAHLDSGTGNILLLGHGWDNAGSNANIGITLGWGDTIAAHGAGAITAIGVAGTGIDYNYGLNMDGTNGTNAITAEDGPITLVGTANGTGQFNHGIVIYNGNTVASTGIGAIRMTGSAAATINSADIVTSTGVNIIGNAVSGGDITFNLDNPSMQQVDVYTPGSITFKPRSPGATIGISGGTCGGTCTLQLTDALLAELHPDSDGNGVGSLIIGDTGAGTGIVDINGWDISGKRYDVEVYGGTIDFTGATIWNQDNSLLFSSRTGNLVIDHNFTRNANLAGDGTLTLKAAGSVTTSGARTISAATVGATGKLHTILWGDADNSGSGSIALSNASISTNGGDVVLAGGVDDGANGGVAGDGRPDNDAWGNAANIVGVSLNNSAITTGPGSIAILGHGRNNAATQQQYGVFIDNGSTLATIAEGNITIRGTGGSGTIRNHGIYIKDHSHVNSVDGDISITGRGNGSGNNNTGVFLEDSSAVASTGTGAQAGTISVTGVGGNGNALNFGISLDGSTISTVDGPITLDGTGGNGTANGTNVGILISGWSADNLITASGSASIGITAAHSNASDYDLYLENAGVANTISSASGPTVVHADTITSFAQNHLFVAGGGLTFSPRTASQNIGINNGVAGLALTSDILDGITAPLITIGRSDGTGTLTLGAYAWDDPARFVSGPAGAIVVAAAQSAVAASDASLRFSGPTTLSASLNTSAATGGTRAILFDGAVTLGANGTIGAGGGNITFSGTVDGAHDLDLATTGDVVFGGAVGAGSRLGAITLTGVNDLTAADPLYAASFTYAAGTGDVNLAFLDTIGDIAIAAGGDIAGSYKGQNGLLHAPAGILTATVDFDSLDITGTAATLTAGGIGAGAPDQTMANRISIGGVLFPALVPDPGYTFASYVIGARAAPPAGGSGSAPRPTLPPGPPPGGLPPGNPGPASPPSRPITAFALDLGNVPFPMAFAGIRANQVMISGDLLLDDPYPTLTELFTDARDQDGSSSPGEHAGTQEKGW